jgi:PAS domain S-box-containing protein
VQLRQLATLRATDNLLQTARLAAANQTTLMDGARQLLSGLAQLPDVRTSAASGQDCSATLAGLLRQYPQYVNLGVGQKDGTLSCSAIPLTASFNISDRYFFQQVLKNRDFSIGDYQVGRLTGLPSVTFGYPVLDSSGQVQEVIFADLNLNWLNQVMAQVQLSPSATLTILDRNGTILVRSPNPAIWIGKNLQDPVLTRTILSGKQEGTLEASGANGAAELYAYAPVGASGQASSYISVGIPTSVAFGEVDRVLSTQLIGLALVTVLVVLAAWLLSSGFILTWVNKLVSATRRLAAGEQGVHSGISYDFGEFGQLAHAFDSMSSSLAQRSRDLSRVNRALKTISECNEALVRTDDEQTLLQKVCDVIVAVGGYRLAWVGYAVNDDEKTIRPTAWAGFDEGYLNWQKLSWGDNEWGHGPSGTAIRTGQPRVIKNIGMDNDFSPWRPEAVERGYGSALSLPLSANVIPSDNQALSDENQPFGVLTIYAPEQDAFDDEEVHLLEELSGDLEYGIQSLRARAGRRQALQEVRSLAKFPEEDPNPVLRAAPDATLLYANQSSQCLLLAWGIATGQRLPDEWADRVREVLQSGRAYQAELTCEGITYAMIFTPVAADSAASGMHPQDTAQGKTSYVNLYARDISEYKRAAAALQENALRLQVSVQAANIGLWDWSIRTNQIYFSPEWKAQIGYQPHELPNRLEEWESRIHPEDHDRVMALMYAYQKKPWLNYEAEFRLRHKDGSYRWILSRAELLPGSNRRSDRMLGVHIDLTERKLVEQEILRLNEDLEKRVADRTAELEAKNHELETFTYSVSHDLKAPLRGIDGYSRLLLEDHLENLNEEGRTFLKTIRRATEQMNQLINDLLDYSRLERRTMLKRPVDLKEMIDLLVQERSEEIKQRGVELVVDITCATVQIEPEGLGQALRNLLDNALKFSRDRSDAKIEILAHPDESGCLISVRDNGIGFDMQYQERIFEIFQRLHYAEEYPGTGIGLAIVRKTMERMGGRAWAESSLGQGAVFYLQIPN